MKVVIDIPADLKKMLFDDEVFDIVHSYRLAMCVKNGTPLPEGATNGDVIKTMFPNVVNSNMDLVDAFNNAKSWWNAPYKGEYNLSEKPTSSESEDKEWVMKIGL